MLLCRARLGLVSRFLMKGFISLIPSAAAILNVLKRRIKHARVSSSIIMYLMNFKTNGFVSSNNTLCSSLLEVLNTYWRII
ncbi:hypothetical protein B0H19DRAFT_1102189 [Mycena capillaripes]|nr:hypothetical protein B0H19DRAFT_1102189 [Mycena capillaripes]